MSTLRGDEAKAHVRALLKKQEASTARRLAAAKQDPDKERFDLQKLSRFLDVRSRIARDDRAEIGDELEREYYLRFPELKSLEAYAERRRWLDANEGG